MILDEAKHILSTIRHQKRYKAMMVNRLKDLRIIEQRLDDLASPKSPQGHAGEPAVQNHVSSDSIIIALLTERDEANAAYLKAKAMYDDAVRYRTELFLQVRDAGDLDFVEGYLASERSTADMQDDYGYTNPYERMLVIIRNTNIRL